jgi:hypothetical protein
VVEFRCSSVECSSRVYILRARCGNFYDDYDLTTARGYRTFCVVGDGEAL